MIENNKLLADFLELEYFEFEDKIYLPNEIWNPRLDWNQLMQVIEKIQEICAKNDDWEKFFLVKDEIPHLGNTYDEVVKFVKEYKNVER